MNPSLNPESTLYSTLDAEATSAPGPYSPSVPISVYRELANELKTTQATVEALSQQNQQLMRQNKLLRNEIQRFVYAADQLGQFVGVAPTPAAPAPEARVPAPRPEREPQARRAEPPEPTYADVAMPDSLAIVPRDRDHAPERPRQPRPKSPRGSGKPRLFTEQREEARPYGQLSPRSPDLGNLWLATTILLVVFTAFGAGFLIMRPLLSR
ncbi:MAG: hypothetical protein IGR92_00245 [Leptolyngbyaceae cyanobacterium T60_A2020_046]|nr:hypothetical protein [Leptolyngbyaceae cyanobacterium T60_A2020_046]